MMSRAWQGIYNRVTSPLLNEIASGFLVNMHQMEDFNHSQELRIRFEWLPLFHTGLNDSANDLAG